MGALAILSVLILTLVLAAMVLWLSSFIMGYIYMAPYVPTRRRDFGRIDRAAALKPGGIFYDLGCGDGRICRYIGRKHPEVKVVGVEIAHMLYLWNKLMGLIEPLPNVKIVRGNALKRDISDANVVYIYALTSTINKMYKPKLIKELRPGARVLSYVFAMPDWPGKTTVDEGAKGDMALNVYEVV